MKLSFGKITHFKIFFRIEFLCPALSLPPDIDVHPDNCSTNASNAGDTCIVSCPRTGYRIYPYSAEDMYCRASGQWSEDVSNIQCEGKHVLNEVSVTKICHQIIASCILHHQKTC